MILLLALLSIFWSLAGVLRSIFTGEGHDLIIHGIEGGHFGVDPDGAVEQRVRKTFVIGQNNLVIGENREITLL